MKTPLYITRKEIVIRGNFLSSASDITIPQGSFVKIIDKRYLPKHVFEMVHNKYAQEGKDVFCYTRFGIFALDYNDLRRDE